MVACFLTAMTETKRKEGPEVGEVDRMVGGAGCWGSMLERINAQQKERKNRRTSFRDGTGLFSTRFVKSRRPRDRIVLTKMIEKDQSIAVAGQERKKRRSHIEKSATKKNR